MRTDVLIRVPGILQPSLKVHRGFLTVDSLQVRWKLTDVSESTVVRRFGNQRTASQKGRDRHRLEGQGVRSCVQTVLAVYARGCR